jgi:hypothetical protein
VLYPEIIKLQGVNRKLNILEESSGCWFVNERMDTRYEIHELSGDTIRRELKEFAPLPNERSKEMVVKGPLTDLNIIRFTWQAV